MSSTSPAFYVGNESSSPTRFTMNNTTFGKITDVLTDARRLQLGLYYRLLRFMVRRGIGHGRFRGEPHRPTAGGSRPRPAARLRY